MMKRFLFLVVFIPFIGFSQYGNQVNKLIKEAKGIMNCLKIGVRDSLQKDGNLKIMLVDTLQNPSYKGVMAVFNRSKAGRVLDSDGKAVKYSRPIIYLSYYIDSVLSDKQNRSKFEETYSKAVLIHELVHFLQKTVNITYIYRQNLSNQDYFNLPDENEALACQAYYLLKHYAPKLLFEIKDIDTGSQEYRLKLYNAMIELLSQKSNELHKQF